jgi:hypothetical protein
VILDRDLWQGNIFLGGEWSPASGGLKVVIEPATCNPLDEVGMAEEIPTGIAHINDQTVSDEANSPFGGVGASGTGSRLGGPSSERRVLHRDALGDDARRAADLPVLRTRVSHGP